MERREFSCFAGKIARQTGSFPGAAVCFRTERQVMLARRAVFRYNENRRRGRVGRCCDDEDSMPPLREPGDCPGPLVGVRLVRRLRAAWLPPSVGAGQAERPEGRPGGRGETGGQGGAARHLAGAGEKLRAVPERSKKTGRAGAIPPSLLQIATLAAQRASC